MILLGLVKMTELLHRAGSTRQRPGVPRRGFVVVGAAAAVLTAVRVSLGHEIKGAADPSTTPTIPSRRDGL